MKTFKDVNPQTVIDQLCADYRRLDTHLANPKHGLPVSLDSYMRPRAGKTEWLFSKYWRNIATLEEFGALINRLDPFGVAIEYFHGTLSMHRSQGIDFTKTFLDEFFISIAVDSLRSALDIYARFVGCYFNFPGTKHVGFGYKYLIEPLKRISDPLYVSCNDLYSSAAYKEVKSFRDKEKHLGLGKFDVSILNLKEEVSVTLRRPEPINMLSLETAICVLLSDYCGLIATTVTEFTHWPLGYDSPEDKFMLEEEDGSFRMPKA